MAQQHFKRGKFVVYLDAQRLEHAADSEVGFILAEIREHRPHSGGKRFCGGKSSAGKCICQFDGARFIGVLFEHPHYAAISPLGLACFIYMTLVPMGLCYVTWFETLRRLPPTSASTGMLIVPVIGVISAAIILGEPLGLREWGAMALTLGGVTLALQRA